MKIKLYRSTTARKWDLSPKFTYDILYSYDFTTAYGFYISEDQPDRYNQVETYAMWQVIY
jgi:hypothetical protein